MNNVSEIPASCSPSSVVREAVLMGNVPVLRFPTFDKSWGSCRLNELAKVIDCKHRTPPYIQEGVPVVSPGSIIWGELDLVSPKKRVSQEEYVSLMDHCMPKFGDLVFSRNQSLGVASFVGNDEAFVLGQDTVLIQAKASSNSFFIYYLLQTRQIQNLIQKLSGGSTFSRINLKDIRTLSLTTSQYQLEQQKIANFLTTVDTKIQQLQQKQTLLQQYKKGVMQQLFSQALRFKDDEGEDYPDWEEKRLGDVSTFYSGGTPSSTNTAYYSGVIPFIKSGEISDTYTKQFISTEAMENSSAKLVKKGDLLFALYGATSGEVAISKISGAINQAVLCIKTTEDSIFIFNYLRLMKDQIIKKYLQGGQGNLSAQIVKKLVIGIPTLAEQQKIANFLTAIDDKITQTTQQLTAAQTFKKGLLQQMFV